MQPKDWNWWTAWSLSLKELTGCGVIAMGAGYRLTSLKRSILNGLRQVANPKGFLQLDTCNCYLTFRWGSSSDKLITAGNSVPLGPLREFDSRPSWEFAIETHLSNMAKHSYDKKYEDGVLSTSRTLKFQKTFTIRHWYHPQVVK